jgi:hypothetical protein
MEVTHEGKLAAMRQALLDALEDPEERARKAAQADAEKARALEQERERAAPEKARAEKARAERAGAEKPTGRPKPPGRRNGLAAGAARRGPRRAARKTRRGGPSGR